ncbi:MFS transporter [Pontivivens insulae]|nr:MFS transporter [Pontivivens insulae]
MAQTVLHHRDFRIYTIGNFFALNGVWLQRISLAWLAWEMTGLASFVGLVSFLLMAPSLLLGPLLGVVADRTDARRATIWVQAALAAVSAALFLVQRSELLTPGVLVAFTTLFGLVMAMHHPLRMTLAPRLVPVDQIGAAVPIISINFNLSRFLGPFIAGALIARYGVSVTMLVTTVSFLPLLWALALIHPREKARQARRENFVDAFKGGLAEVGKDRLIFMGIALTTITSVFGRGVQEILPVIADGSFARGADGLGQLTAAAGFGALIASVWLATHPIRALDGLPRLSVVAGYISLALTGALGLVGSWPVALLCLAGLGASGTLIGVGIQSALQIRLTDDMRGRVMSLWTTTALGATALGALLLGALADAVGLTSALIAAALIGTACFIVALRR